MKKPVKSDEQEFRELLENAERQCQAEFRNGKTTAFGRCPERHLEPSKNPAHKGPAQLTFVKMGGGE